MYQALAYLWLGIVVTFFFTLMHLAVIGFLDESKIKIDIYYRILVAFVVIGGLFLGPYWI